MGGRLGSHVCPGAPGSSGCISVLACPKDGVEVELLCPWAPPTNPSLGAPTINPHPGRRCWGEKTSETRLKTSRH